MATVTKMDREPTCRLCTCRLGQEEDDDMTNEICGSCKTRPEARRLDVGDARRGLLAVPRTGAAREFTPAEKALIRKIHGYVPSVQLLGILNERLTCDLGPDAKLYTMEQLYAEIGDASAAVPSGGHDWASLRKLLDRARRSGLLDSINEQIIDDFAVIFFLNARQVLHLKETLLREKEDSQ